MIKMPWLNRTRIVRTFRYRESLFLSPFDMCKLPRYSMPIVMPIMSIMDSGTWTGTNSGRHHLLIRSSFLYWKLPKAVWLMELSSQTSKTNWQICLAWRPTFEPLNCLTTTTRGISSTRSTDTRLQSLWYTSTWCHGRKDLYDRFRKVTDRDLGIPSIYITCAKLEDAVPASNVFKQLIANNAMKINSRIKGGINHVTDFARPLPNNAQLSDTIIIGTDASHPASTATVSAGSSDAIVGTLDAQGLLYGGSERPDWSRHEVSLRWYWDQKS